jgi:Mg2+ and Co2+ transporter CorA
MDETQLDPSTKGQMAEETSNKTRILDNVIDPLEYFLRRNMWKADADAPQPLRDCPFLLPKLHVKIGLGSGQVSSPFCVTMDEFVDECWKCGFTAPILRKLSAKRSLFEQHFVFGDSCTSATKSLTHLELAMASYEIDAFLLLSRYNIKEGEIYALVFIKEQDYLQNLSPEELISTFRTNSSLLQRQPLLLANVILQFMQSRVHSYVDLRIALNKMESKLGVTRDSFALTQNGYTPMSFDYEVMNADLAGLAKRIADTRLSAWTIFEHAAGLLRLIELVEKAQGSDLIISESCEEVQTTIKAAQLFLTNIGMAQDVERSLSSVLYNRVSEHDSLSMKTIAVVTLFFLPATFVSSIFSTGVFNFQAAKEDEQRTISKYGWVYLLSCLLLTFLTLFLWGCWYTWGRLWLERTRASRANSVRDNLEQGLIRARTDRNHSVETRRLCIKRAKELLSRP